MKLLPTCWGRIMSSVVEKIPMNFLVGLASVTLTGSNLGTGQINNEYPSYKERLIDGASAYSNYLSRNYNIRNISSIVDKMAEKYIEENEGLSDFIDQSILRVQKEFTVFAHKVSLYVDPSEGYQQINIQIFSIDEDKMEKYFSFLDNWVESVPKKFLDQVAFSIG